MTWTYDPTTGRWSDGWNGSTTKPGTLPHQATPPRAARNLTLVDIGQKEANAVWRAILRLTWEALGRGERVVWPNLVAYTPYTTTRTSYRNPRTGAIYTLPTRTRLSVRVATALTDAIN